MNHWGRAFKYTFSQYTMAFKYETFGEFILMTFSSNTVTELLGSCVLLSPTTASLAECKLNFPVNFCWQGKPTLKYFNKR